MSKVYETENLSIIFWGWLITYPSIWKKIVCHIWHICPKWKSEVISFSHPSVIEWIGYFLFVDYSSITETP